MILFLRSLQNVDHSSGVRGDMQLFGAIIDIDKEKIVQKQILDEVVLIEALFICGQQTLKLKYGHFSDKKVLVAGSLGKQNIFELMFIVHLEKLYAADRLGICL